MTYIDQLIQIYTTSRDRLVSDIRKRILWGQSTRYQEESLRMIEAELAKLNDATAKWSWDAVTGSYTNGAKNAYKSIPHSRSFASFGGIHRRAIDVIAQNTQDFLTLKNNLIARHSNDVIRRIGIEVTAAKYADNLTGRETRKLIERKLAESNFFTVPSPDGTRQMRVDSYAELVARTTTAEATNTGTLNQMDAMGQHLVKMTEHNTTCKVCAVYQGRVYKTQDFPDGDPRNIFPHISVAMKRYPGYKTVHPNCKHRLLPYVWEQKTEEQRLKDQFKAQEPIHGDPRGEAERKRYDDAQRKNQERLRDRKQWERYKSVLGDKVPSFSGFRTMKRHNSKRWMDLQAEYNRLKVPVVKPPIPDKPISKTTYYSFKRAATSGEADEFLRSIGVRGSYAKDGVDVEIANLTNRRIVDVKNKFGDRIKLKSVGVMTENWDSKFGGRVEAAYFYSGDVQLHPDSRSKGYIQGLLERSKNNVGWWSSQGPNINHVIDHELGHAIHEYISPHHAQDVVFEQGLTDLYNEGLKQARLKKFPVRSDYSGNHLQYLTDVDKLGKVLSIYGFTNTGEMVAESVAEVMGGSPRPFALKVVEYIMRYR